MNFLRNFQVSHQIADDRRGKAKVTILDNEKETDAVSTISLQRATI
jgi:hypothetical protein